MPSARIPLPSAEEMNPGLHPLTSAKMTEIFGKPREAPLPPHQQGGPCFEVTNARLDAFIVRRDVGPFSVTGLQPAVDSLAVVLAEIKAANPALHDRLGTAGMICVRRVAGSTNISNHAWGTAVDIKVDNVTDVVNNNLALPELIEIAPFFTRHNWYWGAEFDREDSMHFEISLEKMQQWQQDGRFTRDPILQHGHVGTKVRELQTLLNRSGLTAPLATDKVFGDNTLAAVKAFQTAKGLEVDGVVGRFTWQALRA